MVQRIVVFITVAYGSLGVVSSALCPTLSLCGISSSTLFIILSKLPKD